MRRDHRLYSIRILVNSLIPGDAAPPRHGEPIVIGVSDQGVVADIAVGMGVTLSV